MPRGYLKNASRSEVGRKARRGGGFRSVDQVRGCSCCDTRGERLREKELDLAMMFEDEIGEYFTDCEAQPLVCSCLLAGCSFCDHFGDLACLSGVETLPAPEPMELAAYLPTHRRMQGKAADVCELTGKPI